MFKKKQSDEDLSKEELNDYVKLSMITTGINFGIWIVLKLSTIK
jgi:hypothetical protein